MAVFLSHTSLLLDTSNLYSTSLAHRLQTEAFLRGHISLSDNPFGYRRDFSWVAGHGLQQNWGLGVPLLKLPFEWVSAEFGFGPFPDRLILIFYVAFTVVLLNLTIKTLMKTLKVAESNGIRSLISWYFISWVFLSPSMGGGIQGGVNVYDETIFYSSLYVYVLICLLCLYMSNCKDWIFCVLSLLSGFAWVIRPTLIFYAVSIILIALVFVYQNKRNVHLIILGVLCFCLGVAFELWANDVRFGSMLKFGRVWTPNPLFNYIVNGFDGGHFFNENFLSASNELLGNLFLNHAWQSGALRFRWCAGQALPYNIVHLLILILGLLFCSIYLFSRSFKKGSLRPVFLLLAFSFISFVFLFIFYSRLPYLALRYFTDFSGAINIIFLMLIFLAFIYQHLYFKHWSFLLLLFIVLGAIFYSSNERFFEVKSLSLKELKMAYTNKEGVEERVAKFNQGILQRPYLPEVSYCGRYYSTKGLVYQYSGWNIHKDCLVDVTTTAILPSSKCMALNYSISNIKEIPQIQVKRDEVFLKPVSSKIRLEDIKAPYQNQIEQIFCSNEGIADTIPISSYAIAWVTYEQYKNHWNNRPLPIKLNSMSVVKESPPNRKLSSVSSTD